MKYLLTASLLTFGMATTANAVSLSLTAPNTVNIGETFSVNLIVSNLANKDIAAYDIDVKFNNDVINYVNYTLGTVLSTSDGSFDGSQGLKSTKVINLNETSYAIDLSSQPNQFVLATLQFTAFNQGVSNLSIAYSDLSDALANTLSADNIIDTQVKVIPVPSAAWLMGSALLGLASVARKRA